ncbi:sulfotransferase family protein [Haloactinopolyspora alba]|nr:sulfotransferase [Haloactinopolyspora alba]
MFFRRRRSTQSEPVFVGGTGRSGTTVIARLIGKHSRYHLIPIEARFHCEAGGLPSVIAGKMSIEDFRDRLVGHYFERTASNGGSRGLHLADVHREDMERAVDRFVKKFGSGSSAAARDLMSTIFDPVAERAGATAWVEMTPPNVEQQALLESMFPSSKTIHIVRDGRDVAVSVASKPWGPNDPFKALQWWGERLRAAELNAPSDGYTLLVGFEALIANDRERQFDRVCEFLDITPEDTMREFFAESMTPTRAKVGRWRADIPEAEHEQFEETYRAVVDKLHADGVTSAAVLST